MPPCEGGYKEFRIGDLFDGKYGDTDIQAKHVNGLGVDIISSGTKNNGIIGKTDLPARIFPKNTITIDMFGNCFFQPHQYKLVTHARIFSLNWKNGDMNEYLGLYLSAMFAYLPSIYSYNNMCSWEKIKDSTILLPITSKKEIDFQFIESRIRELEEERVRELEAYLSAAGFANCNLTPAEEEALRKFSNGQIKFKKHTIGKLFEIATGRDIIIGRTQKGQIPLISHQHDNNGITKRIAQISNRRLFNYEDTISLADRGVFLATTQNEDFHIGTRVKALTFLDGKQTNNVRLFFVSAINQLQIMFTEYLSNATDSLPTLEIELPITAKGIVDYDFMETYISAIKKQIIQQLKDFIAKEHATYQQVIEKTK